MPSVQPAQRSGGARRGPGEAESIRSVGLSAVATGMLRTGVAPTEDQAAMRELHLAMRAGNPGNLVHWYLRNQKRADFTVLTVLPRIFAGRDELREAMRWRAGDDEIELARLGFPNDCFPVGAVQHAAVRRQLFELFGDAREAARWDTVYHRLTEPLRDPDRAIALLLSDIP